MLGPGKINRYARPCKEVEAIDSLHHRPIDEDLIMDASPSLPEVNNQLHGLANVASKIVVLTSFEQIFSLPPALMVTCYSSNYGGIFSKFKDGIVRS